MYKLTCEVADGAFGRVYQATVTDTHSAIYPRDVAIKALFVPRTLRGIHGIVNLREIDTMQRCRHPNIVRAIEICYGWPFSDPLPDGQAHRVFDVGYIVMPLASKSAYYYIRENIIVVSHIKRNLWQIAKAVNYLHVNGIAHRDLKATNILMFADARHEGLFDAVLCDFGVSKPLTCGHVNSTYVGTALYKPPELLMGIGNYDFTCDIWSLGVLFFELINASYPFDGTSDFEVITSIFKSRGAPTPEVFNKLVEGNELCIIGYDKIKRMRRTAIRNSFRMQLQALMQFNSGIAENGTVIPDDPVPNFGTLDQFSDLLERMLQLDPSQRPSMREVMGSSFFQNMITHADDPNYQEFDLTYADKSACEPDKFYLQKIKDDGKRKIGLNVILQLNSKLHQIVWRMIFFAIDIYDRSLLAAESSGELEVLDADDLTYIAVASCYLAVKYFLDTSTPSLAEIFPRHQNYEPLTIIKWEQRILCSWLSWQIYRPTVYDLLKSKAKPEILLRLLYNHSEVYGAEVSEVARIFEQQMK